MIQAVSAFQRNKKMYLEQEENLSEIVCSKSFQTQFQSWMDSTLAALDSQYDSVESRLAELQHTVAVDEGSYWNSQTLMQHCNLCISSKRLLVKGQPLKTHPSWPDLIQLVSVLTSLKTKGFITPKQVAFLEKVEQELQHAVFEPIELRCIAEALNTKLKDEAESQSVIKELTRFQTAVDDLSPDLDASEHMLEVALLNGDMAVAESISFKQLEMHEHMLQLVREQYPIIQRRHAEAADYSRRRRWAITRMTAKDIGAVIEAKLRQTEACDEDIYRLEEQLKNYAADDSAQKKRYDIDKTESDRYLEANKEEQQSVWNKIHELFLDLGKCQEELTTLADQRSGEVDRRLRMEEREAGRRSGHQSFMKAAADHAKKLQDTIDNANRAKTIAKALNEFVLDGAETVAGKLERRQQALDDVLNVVQSNHFKCFTDFYIAAGRLLYRKERKIGNITEGIRTSTIKQEFANETLDLHAKEHAMEKRRLMSNHQELAEEIVALEHRINKAENEIVPVCRSFHFNGIPFVHPREILAEINLDRADRIVEYRSSLQPQLEPLEMLHKEEEKKLREHERRTMVELEVKKEKKLMLKPRPPGSDVEFTGKLPKDSSGGGIGGVAKEKQYQRFQQLLEKKLTVPEAGPNLATDETAHGGSSIAWTGPSQTSSTIEHKSQVVQERGPYDNYANLPPEPTTSSSATSTIAAAAGINTKNTTNRNTSEAVRAAALIGPGKVLRALFPYNAQMPDEISFVKGDTVVCVAAGKEEGWFTGVCNQKSGLFPANYVVVA